jgi:hypothetical protein
MPFHFITDKKTNVCVDVFFCNMKAIMAALSMLSQSVQVALGAAVVLLLYLASLYVVGRTKASVTAGSGKGVFIVKGVGDARMLQKRSFNTFNPGAPNYLPLARSVNRWGGAQFTYTLWMKLTNPDAAAGKTILLRGNPQRYPLRKVDTQIGYDITAANVLPDGYTTVVVKQPLLRFGKTYDEFVLECNTTQDIEQTFTVASSPNVSKLIPGRWVMLTAVLEDNVPIDDFETGIQARVYVNDALVLRDVARGALRLNDSDLHLLPGDLLDGAYFANVQYISKALTDVEVADLYAKGFDATKTFCTAALTGA